MGAGLRRTLSRCLGWLADRRIPSFLRAPVYRSFARLTGADPGEAQLHLGAYPSLGAFFVRRLRAGARPLDERPGALISPCDGTIQALGQVREGTTLQAKGRPYLVSELLHGAADDVELEGGFAWTIYLGPRDYHRVHAPVAGELVDVRWVPGDRRSVAPAVLAARERVLATNERAVLRLETTTGPCFLVMVGAFNVGRIRVVGVEPGEAPPTAPPLGFARGDELARFELGSTVVLIAPARSGAVRIDAIEGADRLEPGEPIRMGRAIGQWTVPAENPGSVSSSVP